ncbi:MAG: holo-ACP synthase, partial [Bacteroidales bacterium]|nr:holo-ACP synthase [Bacteroidales bacterium]
KNKHKYETLAGLFCLKEAFLKALELGLYSSILLTDIEIKHTNKGAPYIILNEKTKVIMEKENIKNISASITHTKKTAIAICIIE